MQKQHAVLFVSVLVMTMMVGCHPTKPPSTKPDPTALAEKITYAGHGMLFDRNMKEIKLDESSYAEIQESILAATLKDPTVAKNTELLAAVEKARVLTASKQVKFNEKLFLNSAVINRLLRDASEDLRNRYGWRNDALISRYINAHVDYRKFLSHEILELLRRLGFFRVLNDTNYMADCRAKGVPVPPDWAQTGTAWVQQGTLTQNMLSPGQFAAVWTYSDHGKRGGCVALPRGTGAVGSLAGIICQSASTGHACFWDNKKRDDPLQALGWDGKRLVISELVDGSNLSENCTGCHRGNNVFLISPDDSTWGRVLRGPLNGTRTLTFTTQVEASTDNTGGHPRYIPVTTTPPRSGWVNTFTAGDCASSCHEQPVVNAVGSMPPTCSNVSGVSGCYGTP